jgi:hypothetical protein
LPEGWFERGHNVLGGQMDSKGFCRSPNPSEPQDKLLLGCIHRINLDTFWSRATRTVEGNCDKIVTAINLFKTVGLLGPSKALGLLPEIDHCGYEVAIEMVLQSRRPGRYSPNYMHFDTIRKLGSVFSNHCHASSQSNRISLALGNQEGKYQCFLTDPCSLFWFFCFIEGARARMGQDWRPYKAI